MMTQSKNIDGRVWTCYTEISHSFPLFNLYGPNGDHKGHKIKDIATFPFYSLKPLGFPQLLASRKWRLLLYHLMRSNNILCSCWCHFQVIPATTMSLAARKRACCNNKTGVSTAQLVWCISSYGHLSKAAEASASSESPCGSSGRAGPRNMLFRIIYTIMLKAWSLSFCFPTKI